MRLGSAFVAASCVSALLGTSHWAQAVSDYRDTAVYRECRTQGVNDNQCFCLAQYIYLNDYPPKDDEYIRHMRKYPLTEVQTVEATTDVEHLFINARHYCSTQWKPG